MPKAARATATDSPESLVAGIVIAEDLDRLHIAVINLLDMVRAEEIDLVLNQDGKTAEQKQKFVEKVIADLSSPHLQRYLQRLLATEGVGAFKEKHLLDVLQEIQQHASRVAIVKVTVAVSFKEADVKEMAALMTNRLGQQAVLSLKVDHSLIGGAIVQYGSYSNDFSLKSQLDIYRGNWHKAVIEKE